MHHCAALRTRRIICLTCVQPHIPKSMGKLKDGHRIFNLTRQMKGKPCSCHISLTGTLTVSYCLVSYTKGKGILILVIKQVLPYVPLILSHISLVLYSGTRVHKRVWVKFKVSKYGSRFPSTGPGSQVRVQVPEYGSRFTSTDFG